MNFSNLGFGFFGGECGWGWAGGVREAPCIACAISLSLSRISLALKSG